MLSYLAVYSVWFIVFALIIGISMIFQKKWGVSLVATILTGIPLAGISAFITTPPDGNMFDFIYIILTVLSLVYTAYYIFKCLKIQNNTELLRNKMMWISPLMVFIFFLIVGFVIKKYINNYINYLLNLSYYKTSNKTVISFLKCYSLFFCAGHIVIGPLEEELVHREIIFKLIMKLNSQKKILIFFIIESLVFSAWHQPKNFTYFFSMWVFFVIEFCIRYKFKKDGQFWICPLVHSIYNAVVVTIAFMKV